jgi:hypothetical protein
VTVISAGDTTQFGDSEITLSFDPGHATIIASFRSLADTLRFMVGADGQVIPGTARRKGAR